jgi:hypothetical protein
VRIQYYTFHFLLLVILSFPALAQESDSENKNGDKITLLTYVRAISNASGSFRMDQNIVPNFRLNKLLRLEAGLRYGERPNMFNSYFHYKLELQTRSFWNTLRFIARISDNVISYPYPSYRKTNEVFVAEAKFSLSKSWQLMTAGGYVFSAQQNDNKEALPTNKGVHNNYPAFKLSLRYLLSKGFLETSFGSYDTFNPYELNKPFLQEAFEFELSGRCTTYNYFRCEYNERLSTPYNYFVSFGLRFRLAR